MSGEIVGNSNVGMLVGAYNWSYSHSQYFRYCYSTAKVGGIYALYDVSYLQGQNSYFNTTNSGKQSDSKFIALTDEQFKDKNCFEGCDFNTI